MVYAEKQILLRFYFLTSRDIKIYGYKYQLKTVYKFS